MCGCCRERGADDGACGNRAGLWHCARQAVDSRSRGVRAGGERAQRTRAAHTSYATKSAMTAGAVDGAYSRLKSNMARMYDTCVTSSRDETPSSLRPAGPHWRQTGGHSVAKTRRSYGRASEARLTQHPHHAGDGVPEVGEVGRLLAVLPVQPAGARKRPLGLLPSPVQRGSACTQHGGMPAEGKRARGRRGPALLTRKRRRQSRAW